MSTVRYSEVELQVIGIYGLYADLTAWGNVDGT